MIGRSLISMIAMIVSSASYAQGTPDAATTPAAPEKETWKAPFGGNFTAGFAVLNDYSYRGISQTQRQIAVQAALGYETPTVSEKIPLSAYVGAWGSNVNFPGAGTTAEIDAPLSNQSWIDGVVQLLFPKVSRTVGRPHCLEEVGLEFIKFRVGQGTVESGGESLAKMREIMRLIDECNLELVPKDPAHERRPGSRGTADKNRS